MVRTIVRCGAMEENVRLGYFAIGPGGSIEPCSWEQAEALMADENARTIVSTNIPNDGVVRTVFLPVCLVEHGVPQCYETVQIENGDAKVLARYSTLSQAVTGHNAVVQRATA